MDAHWITLGMKQEKVQIFHLLFIKVCEVIIPIQNLYVCEQK